MVSFPQVFPLNFHVYHRGSLETSVQIYKPTSCNESDTHFVTQFDLKFRKNFYRKLTEFSYCVRNDVMTGDLHVKQVAVLPSLFTFALCKFRL